MSHINGNKKIIIKAKGQLIAKRINQSITAAKNLTERILSHIEQNTGQH